MGRMDNGQVLNGNEIGDVIKIGTQDEKKETERCLCLPHAQKFPILEMFAKFMSPCFFWDCEIGCLAFSSKNTKQEVLFANCVL